MTTEMERQRRLPNDHMNGNCSFGTIYHQSSQSRKISIGVMADSSAKTKSQSGKGGAAELQTSQNVKSAKDVPAESKHTGKGTVSPDSGTQNKPQCEESSLLVGKKSSYHNMPSEAIGNQKKVSEATGNQKKLSETIGNQKKVSSLYSTSNVSLQPSGSKIASEKEPGSYIANQMSDLPAINANQKTDTCQRERESSYATPQKVVEPKKGITEPGTSERGNSGPVTLRMKVQELLETVYTPNKKEHNPLTSERDANDLKPKSTTNGNSSSVAMHKQHSQTRETNSGILDHRMRPLTRSLTRKKPQAQKPAPKKVTPLCRSKQAQLEENAFSFVETWSKIPNTDVNQGSKTFKRKETEVFGTRPVKIRIVEGVHKDETQQATDGRKTKASAKSVSLSENRTRDSEIVKPNAKIKEKTSHPFEVPTTRHQHGDNNGNNLDQQPFAKHSSKKNLDPQYDLKSPAFEFKTAAKIFSPISSFQFNHEYIDVDSLSERSFKTKRTRSSHTKGSLKGVHYNANTKNPSMDLQDSPVIIPDREENKCFSSPSKVVQSESSEDASPITAPIISEGNKSISPCQEEDSESSEDGSPNKGDVDCDKFDDSSEQDGFAGAVKLFALALERVQSKIHSTTRRQSAAILLSVSNNIHSQLQNAESKIQNEVEKLTNLGKSKRMHPENQYQEQQEQLKRIYEKFKEDVDQHLEKCRSTLEGLEAHQVQVRGMIEKQRLSHKKYILQTEEAIEKQLNDAQRRLADVHRMAKDKMAKLKYGIAECLKEGLLS